MAGSGSESASISAVESELSMSNQETSNRSVKSRCSRKRRGEDYAALKLATRTLQRLVTISPTEAALYKQESEFNGRYKARVLIAALTILFFIRPAQAEGPTATPVRTAPVVSATAAWGKAFIGSVVPARRSVVGTAVAGRVAEVHTEAGDFVEGNAELAQLQLTAIQMQLASAQADLDARQQELAELVAGPRKEELRRLRANATGAEAVLLNARKRHERIKELAGRNASPKGELDEATSLKEFAEQRLLAANAELDAANAGTRIEQISRAKSLVAKAEAEMNRIQHLLNEHTFRAPFAGYIVKRLAEKGEWVGIGDPIAEIIELNPAEIRLAVPEDQIANLNVGQEVRVAVDAIARVGEKAKRQDLSGEIFRIIPDADARSRSFPVRVRIDNPSAKGLPLIRPGMLARVFLPVGKPEKVLTVPQDALVLDRSKVYLFVVESGSSSRVRRIEVETANASNSMIQVKPRGRFRLSEGDLVVVEGNERLANGQAVERLQ